MRKTLRPALLLVLALASTAAAQDYTTTNVTGRMETRPATVLGNLGQTSSSSNNGVQITLPFEFPYYGRLLQRLYISPSGFVLGNPSFTSIFLNPHTNYNAPGRDFTTDAFPYTPLGQNGSLNPNADGLISPFWENLQFTIGPPQNPASGDTYWWIAGTAPSRRFVISWDNFNAGSGSNPRIKVQLHLLEGTGQVVFAYDTNAAGYTNTKYVCGLDAFGDARFTAPKAATNQNTGYPGSDFLFTPRTATYTGTILYDKIVSDASGIGNSVLADRPLRGARVELRRPGYVVNAVQAAGDGTFSIPALGVASATMGSLHVLPRNVAVVVAPTIGGASPEWAANSSISYAAGAALGTLTLGAGADATGAVRASFNVADACLKAHELCVARTSDAIPRLDTVVDAALNQSTSYLTSGPSLNVGGAASPNSDVWDDAIVTRTYARHVLASIAASPTTPANYGFDAVSDPQNAFAEAFGYLVWAMVSGASTAVDGTGASAATTHDLESPSITVTRGPDVAGCMAGALFDLLDAANETTDGVDGTLTPDRAFQRVDTFTVTPTASTFLQSWVDAGFDAPSVTRIFAANGALADDALEPNDDASEAAPIGSAGVRRSGLVLNRFNEDWVSVTLAAAASSLVADATYDRASVAATVGLEIRDAGGALVGTGAPVGATGPVRAASGPVAAGTYRVRVRHLAGATVPNWSVQVYVPLEMEATPLSDWTAGRDYDEPLGVAGGVPPYTLSTIGSSLPPGLSFSPVTQYAVGTPVAPGTYAVTIQLRDDGSPANVVTRSQTVTIHPPLDIALPGYVAFPAGRAIDVALPFSGGTPPRTFTLTSGSLPAGLTFDAAAFRLTGTAPAGDGGLVTLMGLDVAGSESSVTTRVVVAVALDVPGAAADLAGGDAAAGWWFDAVEGSSVSFAAKVAKGRAKRVLTGAVLAPDRSVVAATVSAKNGGLAVAKFAAPASGRYFVIAAGAAGDPTQLLGGVKLAAPKKGKATIAEFDPSDTTEVRVGLLPGAKLTLKFAGDRKAGLVAKVVGLRDPSGTPVSFAPFVTPNPQGGTFSGTFSAGGTWTVILGATSVSGTPGKLSASWSAAQPKGVVYVAE